MKQANTHAHHVRARWHECPGLRSAHRQLYKLGGLQPYRAGSYRGTWQPTGLPRKLCMPAGIGGGEWWLFAWHEGSKPWC
jgi:hypothetical protein